MGLDFDALEYIKSVKLKQSQPPFACPVPKCDRVYKTVIGLQYHLVNYDHDNPQPMTPVMTPNRKKARSRGVSHSTPKGGAAGATGTVGADDEQNGGKAGPTHSINPESLVSYNDEEQRVTFNVEGKSVRLGTNDALPFIEEDEYMELVERGCIVNADAPPLEQNASWAKVKVPEARFQEIDNYNVPDAPPRPLAYYRFIEKSVEELDGEIEYDVDEEDSAWLEWMNEEREKTGHNAVNIDTMELLMDRLEKESYFQAAANGTATGNEVDDDAVCCICMDGECQNTNVILFCDMCNLAVHQDCYGVPYIPEGQWLCRRCLQSPSTPVNCVLCPNTGGAFKQTDRGQWAHVVCALWIPEVRFANTVFLEPIDSIETIPAARWRLTCYVCKEKGLGACIQCHRNSCYAAFHVTCAQQAGLYMTMDVNESAGHNDSSAHVQKFAFCHLHTPDNAKAKLNLKDFEDARHKMKEARKALAKKRSSAPVVLIPTIPPDRIQEIASMVHMQKKKEFLDRLVAYWTMKRKYRNGVPLLRRLQSQGNHHGVIQRNGIEGSPDTSELYRQLKYWQCLRQDLERARLLCELVRKREKLKAAYVKICEQVISMQLDPLETVLRKLLDALEARDTSEIFREPVDTTEVPDYLDIVNQPMDLGTMRSKLDNRQYTSLDQLQSDFDLMIQNCLAYNNKDTVFYRAGIRMRDQAAPLFQEVRDVLAREGLLDTSQVDSTDHVEQEVEVELRHLLSCTPCEAIVQKLLILADKSQVLKNPTYRTKKIKQIRLEISRMRKGIQKARIAARHNASINSQTEDDDEMEENHNVEDMDVDTPPPIKPQAPQHHPPQHHSLKVKEDQTPKRVRKPSARSMQTSRQNHHHQRRHNLSDEDEDQEHNPSEDEDETMGDESKGTSNNTTQHTPPCSPVKSLNSSASPVGVNRRTAVLFTRKAQAALKRPTDTSSSAVTPVKEENHNIITNATQVSTLGSLITGVNNASSSTVAAPSLISSALSISNKLTGGLNQLSPLSASLNQVSTSLAVKSPKRNARHKRLNEMRNSGSVSPKKSPNRTMASGLLTTPTALAQSAQPASASALAAAAPTISLPPSTNLSSYQHIPDTFRVYRTNNERDASDSDDDDMSDISGSPCSSCSGITASGSASDYDSSDDDDEEDEDDEEEDEEPEAVGDDNATRDRPDIEMNDSTTVGDDANGEAMSCSADSDTDGGATARARTAHAGNDSDTQTRSITRRTPTPLDKRQRNAGRPKKKPALSPSVQPTSSLLPSAAGNVVSVKASTRSNANKPTTRTATPTPNNVNTIKTRKAQHAAAAAAAAAAVATNHNSSTSVGRAKSNHINSASLDMANSNSNTDNLLKPPLEPLQLVWAKCRGYPWYPALILDPKTPKGFVYNGVPLPAPPTDVLALRKNYPQDMEVFLVLFFDAKRTWQWLPANKLDILGIDKELDQQKLVESRKPTERKAVKKAYQDALLYQSQVSDLEGQGPDPIM
ncbi:bromodomain-containing protein homolog [Stomoxys calcitrans]|uniref:bromodomain-containing protein homolog n=1 Tax=Stomoxys calcitrans TaxID=35570 RepID=UPI0027E34DE2|nr:bromodomain-containing protein homolog [Stomoxys calcitrans]XP_059226582.1 bromodomain-containing protein homolog [Stomoxys calcitrans]